MSESQAIVVPVLALVCWTHVMWLWMYVTRLPAIMASGMEMDATLPNGQQMAMLPPTVRWKADNYNHLFEQPTVFYAVALTLAVIGEGSGTNLMLAWLYVAVRIVHSLFQALVNKIPVRFGIFATSSVVLMILTARAVYAVL